MGNTATLEQRFAQIVPPLGFDTHKGSSGRVAVFGGCELYTGAPFFASMAALRAGCDIVHLFCTESAAAPIKAYSPEVIVHPFFQTDYEDVVETFVRKCHAVVVGPGLGRDPNVLEVMEKVFASLVELGIPVVVDADGLFMVGTNIDLVVGKPNVVLTPNEVEFRRLCETLKMPPTSTVQAVAARLKGPVVLRKGRLDQVSNGTQTIENKHQGSPRRCGGQGDILAGVLAATLAWATLAENKTPQDPLCCAVAATTIVRHAAAAAFSAKRRGMVAGDVLGLVPEAVDAYTGDTPAAFSYGAPGR